MFEVQTGEGWGDCSGVSRRSFLQAGTLGLGGLTLPTLLRLRAASPQLNEIARDKSIVMLFLTGGPSQIETFDPKMGAPAEFRSVTGEIPTSIPGVTFGGTLTRMAPLADRMAIIRSFAHDNPDHDRAVHLVARGGNESEAGMGAIVSRLRGTNHPEMGTPTNVYVAGQEIDRQFNKERLRLLLGLTAGELGSVYAPFEPGGNGPANENLKLGISVDRVRDRRKLRASLDRLQRSVDRSGTMESLDRYESQAMEMLLGKAASAFDLSQEDPRTVERYDTSHMRTGLSKYRDSSLGEQMLLARRLCEAGATFVTVHNPGWDMHGGPTQYAMKKGMTELFAPVDHSVSAFLEDIEQRGLSDKVLFILTGEFGRTPKVNQRGGRDHWANLCTLMFAGGGLRMGQVIGQSTEKAERPAARPISLENLFATVLHFLFDVSELRLLTNLPRSVARALDKGEPIHELF